MTVVVKHGPAAYERDEHVNRKAVGNFQKRGLKSTFPVRFFPRSRALKQDTWVPYLTSTVIRGCGGHRTKPKAIGRNAQSTLRRKQPYPTKPPHLSTHSSHRQRKSWVLPV